jgi:uncharacterized protein (UPF0261 family)
MSASENLKSDAGFSAAAVAAFHPAGRDAAFDVGDRDVVVTAITIALTNFVASRGDVGGIIGPGGPGGTAIIAPAMRSLAVGVRKLMVSTMAAGNVSQYVDVHDIMTMFPVSRLKSDGSSF